MSKNIPRTFVFDKRIPEEDYVQYIDPTNYSLEDEEEIENDFKHYSNKLNFDTSTAYFSVTLFVILT